MPISRIPKVNYAAAWEPRSGAEDLVQKMVAMKLKREEAERQQAAEERAAELHQTQMAQKATEDSLKQVDLLEKLNLITPPQKTVQEAPVVEMEEPSNEMLGIKGGKIKMPLGEAQTLDIPQEQGAPVNITLPDGQVVPVTPRTREQQLAAREEEYGRTLDEGRQKLEAEQEIKGTPAEVIFSALGIETPENLQGVSLPPAVAQAIMYGGARRGSTKEWKHVKDESGNVWRINPETGDKEMWIEAGEQPKDTKLRDLSAKEALDLGGMRSTAKKLEKLEDLESGVMYKISDWTPSAVRRAASEGYLKGWFPGADDKKIQDFYTRSLQLDPQYFMFAVETLKATQGSRPSDKDMEWYLENLPRKDDPPEVKRYKVQNLMGDLADKYNTSLDALEAARFDVSGFPRMVIPDFSGSVEAPAGPPPPPPFSR